MLKLSNFKQSSSGASALSRYALILFLKYKEGKNDMNQMIHISWWKLTGFQELDRPYALPRSATLCSLRQFAHVDLENTRVVAIRNRKSELARCIVVLVTTID